MGNIMSFARVSGSGNVPFIYQNALKKDEQQQIAALKRRVADLEMQLKQAQESHKEGEEEIGPDRTTIKVAEAAFSQMDLGMTPSTKRSNPSADQEKLKKVRQNDPAPTFSQFQQSEKQYFREPHQLSAFISALNEFVEIKICTRNFKNEAATQTFVLPRAVIRKTPIYGSLDNFSDNNYLSLEFPTFPKNCVDETVAYVFFQAMKCHTFDKVLFDLRKNCKILIEKVLQNHPQLLPEFLELADRFAANEIAIEFVKNSVIECFLDDQNGDYFIRYLYLMVTNPGYTLLKEAWDEALKFLADHQVKCEPALWKIFDKVFSRIKEIAETVNPAEEVIPSLEFEILELHRVLFLLFPDEVLLKSSNEEFLRQFSCALLHLKILCLFWDQKKLPIFAKKEAFIGFIEKFVTLQPLTRGVGLQKQWKYDEMEFIAALLERSIEKSYRKLSYFKSDFFYAVKSLFRAIKGLTLLERSIGAWAYNNPIIREPEDFPADRVSQLMYLTKIPELLEEDRDGDLMAVSIEAYLIETYIEAIKSCFKRVLKENSKYFMPIIRKLIGSQDLKPRYAAQILETVLEFDPHNMELRKLVKPVLEEEEKRKKRVKEERERNPSPKGIRNSCSG